MMTLQTTDMLPELLEHVVRLRADAADALFLRNASLSVSRRQRQPETLERAEQSALGLRVFLGKRQAVASTTDLSSAGLAELAERTVAMARSTTEDPFAAPAPEALLARRIPSLDLGGEAEPAPDWLQQRCAEAEDAALATPGITNSEGAEASYSATWIELALLQSGHIRFRQGYASTLLSLSVSVLAGEGTDMERDYDYAGVRHSADLPDAAELGKNAAARTKRRLHPRKVSSCRVPIIFEPRAARGLLHALAGALSGAAVARGTSFLKDDLGRRIMAEGITITDDPHMPRGLGSKPFDGEGVANRKIALVEDGTLATWLLDTRSANKLGLVSTGHAARGLSSPPSPAPTNLYLHPGRLSPQEMIGSVARGFYVTELFGPGINLVTGDYSQGASGLWIENGELAYAVSGITIAGHLRDMLRTLQPASDLVFRYATNAPTLRVESMTVAGT